MYNEGEFIPFRFTESPLRGPILPRADSRVFKDDEQKVHLEFTLKKAAMIEGFVKKPDGSLDQSFGGGVMMILYTIFGGFEAAVWIGVLQSIVLLAGPIICIIVLLSLVPGGLGMMLTVGAEHGKFSLGSFSPAVGTPTFWVVLVMGLAINL